MEEKTNWLYMGGTGLVTLGILFVGIKYMHTLLTWFHILVCIGLVLVVLLQSGRAADLAGAFGGSGSQTAFGPRGAATFLSTATTFLAVVFMLTSLSLALISSQGATSVVTDTAPITEESAPAEAPSEETTEGDTEAEDPAPDASPEQEQ
jgi:preprotein translocase subunit SecG